MRTRPGKDRRIVAIGRRARDGQRELIGGFAVCSDPRD